MANAKKCDRCGKYYQEFEPNAFDSLANVIRSRVTPDGVRKQIYAIEKLLDLCPSCLRSLRKWVGTKEDEEDGK